MKIKIMTTVGICIIIITGSYVFAKAEIDHGQVIDEKQAMIDMTAKKAVDAGNKNCPVSGDAVAGSKMGGKPVLYEYNGKIYHLCCPMCIKDFKKNPEKFSKIADNEVKTAKK
jgi:YHS domain-containing protein